MTDHAAYGALPTYKNSEVAPFVYFDVAPAFGVLGGTITIELAARVLIPGEPSVRHEFLATAHLRCSPAAAHQLRAALDRALQMLNGPQRDAEESVKVN